MSEKKLAIIATKGTLDWAYPPFILASTAAALGYETQIFFTFYGLQLLKKNLKLEVSPLGNPGMPMPMGMDKWFPVIGTAIPGMQSIMTMMMKQKMKISFVTFLFFCAFFFSVTNVNAFQNVYTKKVYEKF